MRKSNLAQLLFAFILFMSLARCGQTSAESPSYSKTYSTITSDMSTETSIQRGEYLVTLMDCNSCHTPKMMTDRGPVPDPEKMLSGHPGGQPFQGFNAGEEPKGNWLLFNPDLTTAIGPWGVSYSANLTPDPTGIGNWTFDQFKKAITKGKHKGMENGRMLLPPMPWQSYAELKEEDIHALFDYLQTVKPIENIVPPPIPPTSLVSK